MASNTAPGLLALIREDWETHGRGFLLPGMHAIVVHRLGVWSRGRRDPVGVVTRIVYKFLNTILVRGIYGVEIFESTEVGRRVKIGHHMGVILGARAVIGDDVLVTGGVTIGMGVDDDGGRPVIGNRVQLGAGSMVLGEVTVGDDAKVGPHAVVLTNVPPGASAMASPARVLKPPAPPADAPS